MPIITISRGSYSGAKELAEAVAGALEIPCVAREVLISAARDSGAQVQSVQAAFDDPPSIFDRYHKQRSVYLAAVRATLCDQAAEGSFVYHGTGGHLLLVELPLVLRVRLIAPMDLRIQAVMRTRGISRRRSEMYIKKIDKQRKRWARYLYGVDWTDASLYDITVNLERLSVVEARDLICALARSERFTWDEATRKQVVDLALANRVTAALALSGELFGAELKIEADDGVVTISGTTRFGEVREAIRQVAAEVRGVSDLSCQIQIPSTIFAAEPGAEG